MTSRVAATSALALACCLLLVQGGTAHAQDRPSEDQLFGPSAPAEPAPQPTAPEAPAPEAGRTEAGLATEPAPAPPGAAAAERTTSAASDTARDSEILGGESTPMFSGEKPPDDPLKIGGRIYLRAQGAGLRGQRLDKYAFSTPSLVDAYFDARPNDRVRGFVLGRMAYDPTLADSATAAGIGAAVNGSTMGSASLSSVVGGVTRGPHVYLDQLWLRFDIDYTVFVTAGKQHVRWGTARFWTPTDFLHLRRRNPLDVFDARTGTSMLKLHLPIESKAWNFYAYALTEAGTTTPTLAHVAGAARAELVLGTAELGLGVFAHKDESPKFAADLSTAVGDVDVYSEVAVIDATEVDRVRYEPDAMLPDQVTAPSFQTPAESARIRSGQVVDALYPVSRRDGYRPQVVVGASYSGQYNDNDTFTVGAEYFYNPFGYSSPVAYPGLLLPHARELQNPATFFYLGEHYGALFITFPAPFSLDLHTFSLATLGNLSDLSFITRFDYTLVLLTHLRFESFVSARYGQQHGEFRLGVNELDLDGIKFSRSPAILDFGLGLRLDI